MWLFFEEQRVELNPCHIGLSHIGDVAAGAFGHRRFRGRRRIRLRMMPEGKVTPAVTIGKALVVLYRDVNAVEHPVEIASPGWLGTGTVGECRIKNSRQFLHETSPSSDKHRDCAPPHIRGGIPGKQRSRY